MATVAAPAARRVVARPAGTGLVVRGRQRTERQHAQQRHLESAARIGCVVEIAAAHDRDLVAELQILRRKARRQCGQGLVLVDGVGLELRQRLQQRHALQRAGQLTQRLVVVGCALIEHCDGLHQRLSVACRKRREDRLDVPAVERAQQRACLGLERPAAAEGKHLVEQRQRVTHAALRATRDRTQGTGLEFHLLGLRDLRQPLDDLLRRQAPQVELQAARQDGDRQLLRIGGREQELDVRWRLLQRLEQRIERMRREHVHLVDQVHLVAPARRRILNVVEQLARVVDLGARSRVDLEQIHEPPGVDITTGAALAAGRRGHASLAVERLREDARNGRLADAARACEQERMMDASRIERVRERTSDMVLPDEFVEPARSPFTGKNEVAHGTSGYPVAGGGGGPRQNTPGTRRCRYRCSLPGLTGFTANRREGSDASHHGPARPTTPLGTVDRFGGRRL